MTLRTLNYGNYGIFLILDNAGFIIINRTTECMSSWQASAYAAAEVRKVGIRAWMIEEVRNASAVPGFPYDYDATHRPLSSSFWGLPS